MLSKQVKKRIRENKARRKRWQTKTLRLRDKSYLKARNALVHAMREMTYRMYRNSGFKAIAAAMGDVHAQ